jgi:hypothetical protein
MFDGPLLETVVSALRELGGYFVWRSDDGQEYVILSRREFEARSRISRDTQLGLLDHAPATEPAAAPWTADDMLEKINRDLAIYQLQQEEIELEEGAEEDTNQLPLAPRAGQPFDTAPGKRVRFEPLRGDLPPSLQDE